jgi:hypothetical protein
MNSGSTRIRYGILISSDAHGEPVLSEKFGSRPAWYTANYTEAVNAAERLFFDPDTKNTFWRFNLKLDVVELSDEDMPGKKHLRYFLRDGRPCKEENPV